MRQLKVWPHTVMDGFALFPSLFAYGAMKSEKAGPFVDFAVMGICIIQLVKFFAFFNNCVKQRPFRYYLFRSVFTVSHLISGTVLVIFTSEEQSTIVTVTLI